jgi:iron complex transport system permease protein
MRTAGVASATGLTLLVSAMGLLVLATAWLGYYWISPASLFRDESAAHVFMNLRLPRTLLAAGAGAGLAVGGVIFQALFRNPLAEPYTLGIASGASLAAAAGYLLGLVGTQSQWLGVPLLTLLAFGGAVVAMLAVIGVAQLRSGRDMARLLLAGVCIAYMCAAGTLLVTYLADRAVTNDIVVWMMGSLNRHRPQAAIEVVVVLVPVILIAASQHRALDLLHFGGTVAAARGVAVQRTTWLCFTLVGLLTAVIVGSCGPIAFVGLMIPHIGRALVGVRTLPLLIAAAALGAGFLAFCDGLARLGAVELPVGIVTNILGAGFFFYLLATRDFFHGGR